MPSPRQYPGALVLLATVMGFISGFVSFFSFVAIGTLHARSKITTGTIVRFEAGKDEVESEPLLRPVYAYEVEGAVFEGRCIEAAPVPTREIGARIELRYSSDRPGWSAENKLLAIYFIPMVTGVIALGLFCWRWLLLRREGRSNNRIAGLPEKASPSNPNQGNAVPHS